MKKATILLGALLLIIAVSCREEQEKPKVTYEEPKASKNETPQDSPSEIKVADLPVLMEGTEYLIHPIGDIRVYEDKKTYGSSSTNDAVSYAISNYSQFEITGFFENLRFQHVDSTAIRSLTEKQVQIQTATLVTSGTGREKKQYLVYTVVDSDTNRDSKVDANDIRSLYISDISGNNFKKVSKDLQELIDWTIVDTRRLYFRTIEDINKNGAFDKNDSVHYNYANLGNPELMVSEYNPLKSTP